MRLNRTGRKFAVVYVAVTLTVFVCQELTRVPITLVHHVAWVIYWELAFLCLGLNYWSIGCTACRSKFQASGR